MVSRAVAAIGFAAFAAGWTVMSLQILGGRLMAPSFGQTVYQWGALIGTTMTFMAAGYWAGGRLGAGARANVALPLLLGAGAACAALSPWLGRGLVAAADLRFGPLMGAVVASAALLGVPAFTFAAVSPLCVARLVRAGDVAAASGMVSALGAFGSIGGTFFAAFYAIPNIGITAGYGSAALVAGVAAVVTGLPRVAALFLLVPLGLGIAVQRDFAAGFVEMFETPYNTVMVSQSQDTLYLAINSPQVVQSLRRADGGPTGMYWDMLAAVPALAQGDSVLFLGVAGGSAVEATSRAWPGIRALGVEIDGGVTEVARRRFALEIPVVTQDARRFIDRSDALFDVIVIDLYATGQIPAYVATREFYAAVARRLARGGVVALNVFDAGDPAAILHPVAATLASVFPGILLADAGRGNTIVLAWSTEVSLAEATAMLAAAPATASAATAGMLARLGVVPADALAGAVLTDDRSDLEMRAARALGAR